MKTYKHSPFVHLVFIAAILLFGLGGIGILFDHHFKGGFSARLTFMAIALLLSLAVLALYLTSGLNRYAVTEEGLRVDRFLRSTFHPWSEITRVAWSLSLHTFFVYGPDRMIFYSSTDFFPSLAEFLQIIHQRSKCQLSQALEKALTSK